MVKELWDAFERNGKPLGFDLVRGEPLPEGAWHMVVEIYAVTTDGRVLTTRRHPDKSWGGYWEVTGGSVLKGETPVQGALRELREETGVTVPENELHPVYVQERSGIDGYPSIYHSFLVFFDPAGQTIRLQDGETVDYRFLPYEDYKAFIQTEEFVTSIGKRFQDHQEAFDQLVSEHIRKK